MDHVVTRERSDDFQGGMAVARSGFDERTNHPFPRRRYTAGDPPRVGGRADGTGTVLEKSQSVRGKRRRGKLISRGARRRSSSKSLVSPR